MRLSTTSAVAMAGGPRDGETVVVQAGSSLRSFIYLDGGQYNLEEVAWGYQYNWKNKKGRKPSEDRWIVPTTSELKDKLTVWCNVNNMTQGAAINAAVSAMIERDRSTEERTRFIDLVADFYDVSPDDLRSHARLPKFVIPRHVGMAAAKELFPVQLRIIGDMFCRDHAAVIYATKKVARSDELTEAKNNLVDAWNRQNN